MLQNIDKFLGSIPENGLLNDILNEYKQDPEYVAEELALRIAEDAARIMHQKGLSRSQLARQMGVSRAYVTRFFDAPPNMTLRSIAKLALALEVMPEMRLRRPNQYRGAFSHIPQIKKEAATVGQETDVFETTSSFAFAA